jgi:hypothetical protein
VTPEVIQGLPLEANAVVAVHHRPHLRDQVTRALHDAAFVERIVANQQAFVADVLGPTDGQCAQRAARGILLTVGRTPPPGPLDPGVSSRP